MNIYFSYRLHKSNAKSGKTKSEMSKQLISNE